MLQLLEELLVALRLLLRAERVELGEVGEATRLHLSGAVQLHRARALHVQRSKGELVGSGDVVQISRNNGDITVSQALASEKKLR